MRTLMMSAAIPLVCVAVCGTMLMYTGKVYAKGQEKDDHMVMTSLQPIQPGDKARADAVVIAARTVAERYVDYKRALADGYKIFMPDQKQSIYHFVLESADDEAKIGFNPNKPGALLYERLAGSRPGYKLVGVMYTDRFGASEKDLNERIPLSIAQWHEHVNMCVPAQRRGSWLTNDPQFGLSGSITTEAACTAAGGTFRPHLSGWMTHVYPFETDRAKIWQAGMNDDHSGMQGMKK